MATPKSAPCEHPIFRLQRALGNKAVLRMLQTQAEERETGLTGPASPGLRHDFSRIPAHPPVVGAIQTKLAINQPGDEYEQEADRVSNQVMRMSEPQLKPQMEQAGREHGRLQTKRVPSNDSEQIAVPLIVHEILAAPGQPLDAGTRTFMEPRFGTDFSRVRVHTGAAAEQSARAVNANAYTVGQSIVFGSRQYAPQTAEGRLLLAHELAHVVQQGAAGPPQAGVVQNIPVSAPGDVHLHLGGGVAAGKESCGSGLSMALNAPTLGVAGYMLQRQVVDPRALDLETIATPRQLKVSEWLVEAVPGGGTARTELYWADFEVDSKGLMTASVRTVSADRTYRSGRLRFGDSFRDALQHFRNNGIEVNAFEGDWSYMTEDEISDNLRVFREGMAEGLTREAAARRTPTGKVAAGSGFEVTNVENVAESQPHLASAGVRRWRVKVTFRRQSPVPKAGLPSSGGGGTPPGSTAKAPTPTTPPRTASGITVSQRGPVTPAGGGPSKAVTTAVPLEGSPPVTARDLAAEMRQTETSNRRMAGAANIARYVLEGYNFLGTIEQIAYSLQLATSALAGTVLQKVEQQAINIVDSATELADYYDNEGLRLNKSDPPGGWAAWDGGWSELKDIQLSYYVTELHIHEALQSVLAALKDIGGQIQELADVVEEKEKGLILPMVSTAFADVYLYADAAGRVRSHLIDAANAYARARRALLFSRGVVQSHIKVIEIRLRQLGVAGYVDLGLDDDDLKTTPLYRFTMRDRSLIEMALEQRYIK
jgi:hypothetical protein